jgi:putative colanic acid biosynthesis acetyltransferase WcaF
MNHPVAEYFEKLPQIFPLLRPPIMVGPEAWICADAFVGPGVKIGEGAIVGARAVAMKNMKPWSIVIGNPARETKKREINQ